MSNTHSQKFTSVDGADNRRKVIADLGPRTDIEKGALWAWRAGVVGSIALSASQLSPAIFPLFYDVVLLPLLFLALLFSTKKEVKLYAFYSVGFFIFLLLIFFIWQIKYYGRAEVYSPVLLQDYRPFLVIFLCYIFLSLCNYRIKFFLFFILPLSVCFFLNIASEYFSSSAIIAHLFHAPYVVSGYESVFGQPMTVAHVAALQSRYSGVFLQPVASGLFHAVSLFCLSAIRAKRQISLLHFFVLVTICFYNGLASQSTVFYFSFLLLVLFTGLKQPFIKRALPFLIFCGSVFLYFNSDLRSFFYTTVASGRFGDDSNLTIMLDSIDVDFFDVIFGFSPAAYGYFGKGAGDSGYVIKMVNGGLIYLLFYFGILIMFMRKMYKELRATADGRRAFSACVIFLLCVEVGTTGFSLPQVSVFVFAQLFLVGAAGNKNNNALSVWSFDSAERRSGPG